MLACLRGLLFDPDNGDSIVTRNIGTLIPNYTGVISQEISLVGLIKFTGFVSIRNFHETEIDVVSILWKAVRRTKN
jgi:hypothetical protein